MLPAYYRFSEYLPKKHKYALLFIVKQYKNSKGTKENPLPKGFDRPAQLPPILKAKLNFAVPSFKRYGSAKTESFLPEKRKE